MSEKMIDIELIKTTIETTVSIRCIGCVSIISIRFPSSRDYAHCFKCDFAYKLNRKTGGITGYKARRCTLCYSTDTLMIDEDNKILCGSDRKREIDECHRLIGDYEIMMSTRTSKLLRLTEMKEYFTPEEE